METTEKIVEAYCRYIKGWFTIPNIKCEKQKEIDLLAVEANKRKINKYHIEVSVSISGSFSPLTNKEFDVELLKNRTKQAEQRRTIGFYIKNKFNHEKVLSKLKDYEFNKDYKKVIVTWGWKEDVKKIAIKEKIILWDFRDIIDAIANSMKNNKKYFTDDTLRTLQLYVRAIKDSKRISNSKLQ